MATAYTHEDLASDLRHLHHLLDGLVDTLQTSPINNRANAFAWIARDLAHRSAYASEALSEALHADATR